MGKHSITLSTFPHCTECLVSVQRIGDNVLKLVASACSCREVSCSGMQRQCEQAEKKGAIELRTAPKAIAKSSLSGMMDWLTRLGIGVPLFCSLIQPSMTFSIR